MSDTGSRNRWEPDATAHHEPLAPPPASETGTRSHSTRKEKGVLAALAAGFLVGSRNDRADST